MVVVTVSTTSSPSSGIGATLGAAFLGVIKLGSFILGTGEGGTAMVGAKGEGCVLSPSAETAGIGSGAIIVGAGATGAGAGAATIGGPPYPGGRVTLTTTSGWWWLR